MEAVVEETEADAAHVEPGLAAALLGVLLTQIPFLAPFERNQGFVSIVLRSIFSALRGDRDEPDDGRLDDARAHEA